MKVLVTVWMLLSLFVVHGQVKQPRIDRVTLNDRIIHGSIDEKYDITVYLRFHQNSENNFLIYSVEGWYYYNNVKKQIPLVGVYCGTLTLYQFDKKAQADSVLNLISAKEDPFEQVDELTARTGYKEKFELDYVDGLVKGMWKSPKKDLPVIFYESNVSVNESIDYLLVPLKDGSEAVFNLAQIGPVSLDYHIAAKKKVGEQWRFLLKYETMSSGNPNGYCGAGQEIGYVLLVLDAQGEIIEFNDVVIESCHRNIYFEKASTSSETIEVLQVFEGEESEKQVDVNLNLVQLTVSKPK